jgi:hypothetical protein
MAEVLVVIGASASTLALAGYISKLGEFIDSYRKAEKHLKRYRKVLSSILMVVIQMS